MSLSEYRVSIGGVPTVLQLDDRDAARYGERAVRVEQAAPRNKARTADHKMPER